MEYNIEGWLFILIDSPATKVKILAEWFMVHNDKTKKTVLKLIFMFYLRVDIRMLCWFKNIYILVLECWSLIYTQTTFAKLSTFKEFAFY